MNIESLKKHAIFHKGFDSHTAWSPQSLEQLELLLKTLTLFYRGVVVADSDFNNNPVFFSLTQQRESILHDALASGFLRRAARMTKTQDSSDGAPVTQQSIFSSFQKNSPERASRIPEGHPRCLDNLFERVECTHKPLSWTADQLSDIFRTRLIVEMYNSKGELDLEAKILADRVIDYVLDLPDPQTLRATVLEKELFHEKDSSSSQRLVWDLVLQAYTGNVALLFDLMLGEPANGKPSVIPSGPEASDVQMLLAADFYVGMLTSQEKLQELFLVTVEPTTPQYDNFLWKIDPNRLRTLSFSQLEEIRESAGPDRFFDLRFETLGSSDKLAGSVGELWNELSIYGEKLISRGIATPISPCHHQTTQKSNNIFLEIRESGSSSNDLKNRKFMAGSVLSSSAEDISAEVVLADFKSLMKGMNAKIRHIPFHYSLKRPNLKIIDRVGKKITH